MPSTMTGSSDRTGPALLGIDLGTSSVKAVVIDARAVTLAQVARPYAVDHPHRGWSQTEPSAWWHAVVDAVRAAVGDADVDIAGIGLSGQMHGVVLTDQGGQPLRPAVLWSDSRAVPQVDRYRSLPSEVLRRLANPLSPGMFGPILGWLAANEPHTFRAARWALSPKDWIRFRLTGVIASEPSDASATLLYDIPGECWDVDVAHELGIDPQLLPTMLPYAAARSGTLLAPAADQLGLTPAIPVAAGGGDTAVAALGAGIVSAGQGLLTIGTGIQIVTPEAQPIPPNATPVTHLYRAATDNGWYRMAAALNGGATLDWVRDLFDASWAELYATAEHPVADDSPLFLPHLTGERTPYMDTALRGSWAYLDPRHGRTDMLRAALEGVALTTRAAWIALTAAGCSATTLRLAGGGTTTQAWRQMLADTLQVELEPIDLPAASGRGAALLGGRAAGLFDESRAIALVSPSRAGESLRPDRRSAPRVVERFDRFERLLHALRGAT
jgi:xylulokinase